MKLESQTSNFNGEKINIQSNHPLAYLFLLKDSLEKRLTQGIYLNEILISMQLKRIPFSSQLQSLKCQNFEKSESVSVFPSSEVVKKRKMISKSGNFQRNQTKNIPKNFGKAIISFILQKQVLVERLMKQSGLSSKKFLKTLKNKKNEINSIAELRSLWTDEFEFAKQMRKLSMYFLKRVSLKYIFQSRISNIEGHVKYRTRIIDVLKNPEEFTSVKN